MAPPDDGCGQNKHHATPPVSAGVQGWDKHALQALKPACMVTCATLELREVGKGVSEPEIQWQVASGSAQKLLCRAPNVELCTRYSIVEEGTLSFPPHVEPCSLPPDNTSASCWRCGIRCDELHASTHLMATCRPNNLWEGQG